MLHTDLTEPVSPERVQEAFKKALCDTLLQSPVLGIISRLQRTLDVLDIEGLSKLWRAAQLESSADKQIPPLGESQAEPSITDWVDFVTDFESIKMREMDHDQSRTENIRYYLLAYLLSATFKDCSIIVRLELLNPGKETDSDAQVEPVRVIDLDPKSMKRLPRWEGLDKEIVSSYKSVERKICIDG
jgi:inositol-pentakisphosphate 2-kinase